MRGKQVDMALAVPQRRRTGREHEGFYAAVIALRRKGWSIYRAGNDHAMVNGERWAVTKLLRAAKAGA